MRKIIVGPDLGEDLVDYADEEGIDGLPHSEAVVVELPEYTRVFIAGTGPLDEDEELVAPGDAARQLEVIFDRIDAILAAVGGDRRDIVRLNLYTEPLTDEESRAVARVRHAFLVPGHEPASTTVVSDGIGLEGMRLEVDADVIVPRDGWDVDSLPGAM